MKVTCNNCERSEVSICKYTLGILCYLLCPCRVMIDMAWKDIKLRWKLMSDVASTKIFTISREWWDNMHGNATNRTCCKCVESDNAIYDHLWEMCMCSPVLLVCSPAIAVFFAIALVLFIIAISWLLFMALIMPGVYMYRNDNGNRCC